MAPCRVFIAQITSPISSHYKDGTETGGHLLLPCHNGKQNISITSEH